MTLTITYGWWVLPAAITLALATIAWLMARNDGPDQYGAGAFISGFFWLLAITASLIVWLVYLIAVLLAG